jgi:hypothetical protein
VTVQCVQCQLCIVLAAGGLSFIGWFTVVQFKCIDNSVVQLVYYTSVLLIDKLILQTCTCTVQLVYYYTLVQYCWLTTSHCTVHLRATCSLHILYTAVYMYCTVLLIDNLQITNMYMYNVHLQDFKMFTQLAIDLGTNKSLILRAKHKGGFPERPSTHFYTITHI